MNIHNERLIRLANHLENGPLSMKWDFRTFGERTLFGKQCGCAISQLPTVFSEWKTRIDSMELKFNVWPKFYTSPVLEGCEEKAAYQSAMTFFDIKPRELVRLFIPVGFTKGLLAVYTVNAPDATKEQVAAEIRKFVKEREARASDIASLMELSRV